MEELESGGIAVTVNRDFCRLNSAVRAINEFKMDLENVMEMEVNANGRLEIRFPGLLLGGM